MTEDRVIHGLIALLFLFAFCRWVPPKRLNSSYISLGAMALIGSWIPDWDLLLGIGFHRSPITHSALPVLVFGVLLRNRLPIGAIVGLALGVASHLIWDTVQYGNVVWIPGGNADRIFLLVNALLLLIGASLITPKLIQVDQLQEKASGAIKPTDEPSAIEQKRKPDPSKMTKEKFLEYRRQQAIKEGRIPKPIVSDRLTWTVIGICLVLMAAYFIAAMFAG